LHDRVEAAPLAARAMTLATPGNSTQTMPGRISASFRRKAAAGERSRSIRLREHVGAA
jgi:hypothetical protein